MRRKIIQLAGKTLVISLPSDWARSLDLKKGEELEVSKVGTSIVVEKVGMGHGYCSDVDLTGLNASLIWHSLVSHYVAGAGEIRAVFANRKVLDPRTGVAVLPAEAVERVVENLIGMEIDKQSRDSVTIREISSVAPDEYPNVMRRVWLTCIGMVEEGSAALERGDREGFAAAVRVERNVNRFVLYALRMLNRGVASNVSTALADARILHALENFADVLSSHAKSVPDAKGVKGKKGVRGKEIVDSACMSAALKTIRCSYDYWFRPSNQFADSMYAALIDLRRFELDFPEIVAASDCVVEAAAPSHALIRVNSIQLPVPNPSHSQK